MPQTSVCLLCNVTGDESAPNYAVVTLTAESIRWLLHKMELAKTLQSGPASLYALEYWRSCEVEYFSHFDMGEDEEVIHETAENQFREVVPGPYVDNEPDRVDLETVVVTGQDVHWQASHRHGDNEFETRHISKETLLEHLHRLEATTPCS